MASLGTSGCAPLWRATPLSPVGQSEGSRAEDAGCPLLAGGEPGRRLWWCLASSPTELVTSAGVFAQPRGGPSSVRRGAPGHEEMGRKGMGR